MIGICKTCGMEKELAKSRRDCIECNRIKHRQYNRLQRQRIMAEIQTERQPPNIDPALGKFLSQKW